MKQFFSPLAYCSQTSATIQNSLVRYIPSITGTSHAAPLLTLDGWLQNNSPAIGLSATTTITFDIHNQPRPATGADAGCDQWTDADSDELPDWWEAFYLGGHPADASAQEMQFFLDCYLAGLDPNEAYYIDGKPADNWSSQERQTFGVAEHWLLVDYTLFSISGFYSRDLSTAMQSATLTVPEANEVSFLRTPSQELESDDAAKKYGVPHWRDVNRDGDADDTHLGERNLAVAFTRNTAPSISCKFHIPNSAGCAVKLRATGTGGINFPESSASLEGENASVSATATAAFPNTVKHYDKNGASAFTLDWEYQIDNGSWQTLAQTKHTVYVTLADPETTLRQETLFYLGCKNADGIGSANAATDTAATTAAIWSEFTDQDVGRVDGIQMTYYNSFKTNIKTTEGLLEFGDGQCSAWAKLFLDILKVQGIQESGNYVVLSPSFDNGFLVNNWTFPTSGNSGFSAYPYLNLSELPFPEGFVGTDTYIWRYQEVIDAVGIAGQGTSNPASFFSNHQIAFMDGIYYDPSYGKSYATLQDIDDGTIAGYWMLLNWAVDEPTVNLDLNGNGNKTDLGINTPSLLFRKNPLGCDIKKQSTSY